MPRIPHLRVIIESSANSGRWNMAVDEALLESAVTSGIATIRFYQWDQPTVSLGYFQKSAELFDDPILSRFPTVRRLSGGGAILHDDELTHSVALPATQTLFQEPQELYDLVHLAISDVLQVLGFPVTFRGSSLKKAQEPLLCFQRADSHDITLNGHKVLGSAQRRRRGAVLQHGSLIRRASVWARHLPGLVDLCNVTLPEDLDEILAVTLASVIAKKWEFGNLGESEIELTKQLCEQQSLRVEER